MSAALPSALRARFQDYIEESSSGRAAAPKAHGCRFLYLPPYFPDLNPIEMAFSKRKPQLRRIGARTLDQMFDALSEI